MKLTDEMIRIKARENGASYGKKAELDFGAGAEWARDYYEKENSNVAEPNRYNVLGEVRAVITEMLLPHISSDSEDVAITKMYALRNSYIDTYNNTIRDVLKKLSKYFS